MLTLLAQASDPASPVINSLVAYGPLGVFMAVILGLLVWYAPQLTRAHVSYLERTATQLELQTTNGQRLASTQETLTRLSEVHAADLTKLTVADAENLKHHQRTQRALICMAEAAALMSENPMVKSKIEAAIKSVSRGSDAWDK